jgi:CHAT domain-containing protein/tetratricopeptide (TPR) repeat protein
MWSRVARNAWRRFVCSKNGRLLSLLMSLATAAGGRAEGELVTEPRAASPTSPLSEPLELGKTHRREIGGGQVHRYRMELGSGDYVHILVEQLGSDVAVAIVDSHGKRLAEMDTPTGNRGPEEISWISEAAGSYTLEVSSSDDETSAGAYEVLLQELRPHAANDRPRLQAERLSAEGHLLGAAPDAASRRKGVERLAAALPFWHEVREQRGEAITLYSMARTLHYLDEWQKAIAFYAQALKKWRSLGDRNEEASSLFGLAVVEFTAGKAAEALAHYREALELERQLGNRAMEAEVLSNLGLYHDVMGEKRNALQHYELALPLMRSTRNRAGELRTLNNLGFLFEFQGEKQKALDAYLQALDLSRQLREKKAEAMVRGNLGRLYADLGEGDRASAYLKEALAMMESLGDGGSQAAMLVLMGQLAADSGTPAEAVALYAQALPLARAIKNRRREATILNSLGEARLALGELQAALGHFEEALASSRESGDRYLEGRALTNRAAARTRLGESDGAMQDLHQALEVRRAIGDRAGEVIAFLHTARLERARGDLNGARLHIEGVLDLLESLRTGVSSRELRASYNARVQASYEFAIDLLMELHRRDPSGGFAARALETAERARARSFLEMMAESGIDVREGVGPTLLDRERSLSDLLKGKLERQLRLAGERPEPEQDRRIAQEILSVTAELEQVETQIRSASPRYAALTQPRPLAAAEMQRDLLDNRTALLEYALGEEKSFLWVVTSDSLAGYDLPGRAAIEAAARRLYERLSAFKKGSLRANESVTGETEALSEMLLAPATRDLADKRLLIVAEGALHYVPFAALPDPAAAGVPLIVGHEIVNLPSASVLAVLRAEAARRKSAPKQLAVFADPVFDDQDQRVRGIEARAHAAKGASLDRSPVTLSESALTRSGRDVGLEGNLPRLLYTRREARAILDLVPEAQRFEAMDFAASRAAATDPRLADYRFLHFATHGFFNSRYPELSGIVLSLVDRQGRPQDGFLTMRDIFHIKKLPAEVVVLSACQTALGKEIRGEGLVGITRGFMYAGASRVVASLWTVGDVATAKLMKRFYSEMLGPSRASPAAALRAAQTAMWKTRRWSAPYYWAAFVLQGEWN